MKKLLACLIILLIFFMLTACMQPGGFNTTILPHQISDVSNEKYVDLPSSVVWDNLVKELSKSYFIINNIDKESRIINVSFSSNNSCEYLNCGDAEVHVRKTSLNQDGKEHYKFKICESNSLVIEKGTIFNGVNFPTVIDVNRKTQLEGRINIYIAPMGSGTLITVNTRYILTFKLFEQQKLYSPAGVLVNVGNAKDEYSCSFDSKHPKACEDLSGRSFTCCSNGKLEMEILDLVK